MSYSYTRTRPVRHEELLVGGSLYWVLQKQLVARQALLGFDSWVHIRRKTLLADKSYRLKWLI